MSHLLLVFVSQEFHPLPHKLQRAPPTLRGEPLKLLMEANEHVFVLDEVTRTQLPYQADFMEVHHTVFADIEARRLYSLLQVRGATGRPCFSEPCAVYQ